MNRPQSSNPLTDGYLIYLCFVTAIQVAGISSMSPILPQLARRFGVENHLISLTIIAVTVPGIIFTPISGILADRIGRKPVLMTCLLLFGIFGTLCVLAPNFEVFLIFRLLQGVGSSALGLVNVTIISDLYHEPAKRTEALAYLSASLSLSSALVPSLSGFLAEISIDLVMLLPSLALPLAYVVYKKLNIHSKPSITETLPLYLSKTAHLANRKEVWVALLLTLGSFGLLFGAMVSFLPILIDVRFHAAPYQIGMIFTVSSIGTLMGTLVVAKNVHSVSPKMMLIGGFLLFCLAQLTIPHIHILTFIALPAFFWGMGQGLNAPMLNGMVLQYAPMQYRSGLIAIQNTSLRFAQAAGPAFFSLLYVTLPINWVFYTGSIIAVIMLGIVFIFLPFRETHDS